LALKASHRGFGFSIEAPIDDQRKALLVKRCLKRLDLVVQIRRRMLETII